MDSDLELLQRWREGERSAGQDLFARHFDSIYRFFEHKVGAAADDLAQRTFLACTEARDRFAQRSSFRTYLFGIARNELYLFLRRQAQGKQVDFDLTSIGEIVTTPSSKLGRAEETDALREALATLPAEQQLLLELHYWHELDAAALAEVFATNAGNIRVRLLRARQALRARLSVPAGAETNDKLLASLSEPDSEENIEPTL